MGDRIDRATLLQFISEVLEGNAYCDNALYKYVLQGAKKPSCRRCGREEEGEVASAWKMLRMWR